MEVLISEALIDSNISHDEFALIRWSEKRNQKSQWQLKLLNCIKDNIILLFEA